MTEDDSFTLAECPFPLFFLLLGKNYLNYRWGPLGSVGVISRIHFGSFRFISVHFGFIPVSFRFHSGFHFGSFRFISVHFGSSRFISVHFGSFR